MKPFQNESPVTFQGRVILQGEFASASARTIANTLLCLVKSGDNKLSGLQLKERCLQLVIDRNGNKTVCT